MRAIMIIGDGMADRPIPELGYRTPLEAADPRHMDKLASNGVSGLLDVMRLVLNVVGNPERLGS